LFLFWTACSIDYGDVQQQQQQHQQQQHALNAQQGTCMQEHLMPISTNTMTISDTLSPKCMHSRKWSSTSHESLQQSPNECTVQGVLLQSLQVIQDAHSGFGRFHTMPS